jgi:hypothetical protein
MAETVKMRSFRIDARKSVEKEGCNIVNACFSYTIYVALHFYIYS